MKIDRAGFELIKQFEGCRLTAYQDSVGVWTIGYGLTSAAGFAKVDQGMTISQQQADSWLVETVIPYEQAVVKAIHKPMTQKQFNAMVSLCYNIGQGAFASSSLVRDFNAGNIKQASYDFLKWNRAGGVVNKGLMNRRAKEQAVFLTPDVAPTASNSIPAPMSPKTAPSQPAPANPPPKPLPSVAAPPKLTTVTAVIPAKVLPPVAVPQQGSAPMAPRITIAPAAKPVGFVEWFIHWLEDVVLNHEAKKPVAGGSR